MTTTRLIIARHGNTFNPGEPPRRIGARTDLPLVESGRTQAVTLGRHLRKEGLIPDLAFSSRQQRTIETARLALAEMGTSVHATPLAALNELDYGPDENQPEDQVIARLGAQALKDWDEKAIVPTGWQIDPAALEAFWQDLARSVLADHAGKIILIVTSNGTARFAPRITGSNDDFRTRFSLKLSTGAYGLLDHDGMSWQATGWNVRPVA